MTRVGGRHSIRDFFLKRPKAQGSVTRKLGAETFARFEGKCAMCKEPIKKKDPICGVFIDGQGHEWDCKTCAEMPQNMQ